MTESTDTNDVHAYDAYYSATNPDNRAMCGQMNPASYAFSINELKRVTCLECRERILVLVGPWV